MYPFGISWSAESTITIRIRNLLQACLRLQGLYRPEKIEGYYHYVYGLTTEFQKITFGAGD